MIEERSYNFITRLVAPVNSMTPSYILINQLLFVSIESINMENGFFIKKVTGGIDPHKRSCLLYCLARITKIESGQPKLCKYRVSEAKS
jgi:hypothetical protein